jgi:hypothetical protein
MRHGSAPGLRLTSLDQGNISCRRKSGREKFSDGSVSELMPCSDDQRESLQGGATRLCIFRLTQRIVTMYSCVR